jgi:hypothetical protein
LLLQLQNEDWQHHCIPDSESQSDITETVWQALVGIVLSAINADNQRIKE